MKKLIFALFLFIGACGQQGSSDGYYFEKDSKRIDRQIKTVLYPNQAAIVAAYETQTGKKRQLGNEELQAFSVIGSQTCTIHMVDPAIKYQPDFIGHELTHCLYGDFHPSQNER